MYSGHNVQIPSRFPWSFLRALWSIHHGMTAISFKGELIHDQAVTGSCCHLTILGHLELVHAQLWGLQLWCEHQLHVVSFMEIILLVSTEARSMKIFRVATQSIMATKNKLIGKTQMVSTPIFYGYREGTMMLQRFCWSFLDLIQTAQSGTFQKQERFFMTLADARWDHQVRMETWKLGKRATPWNWWNMSRS